MHRTVVNRGIDVGLDSMKETYDGMEDLLNRMTEMVAATVPVQHRLNLSVLYFPQIGYVISIPIDLNTNRGNYEGGDSSEGRWDRIFSTESRVYYKDFLMKQLDDSLGDIHAQICGKLITLHFKIQAKFLCRLSR